MRRSVIGRALGLGLLLAGVLAPWPAGAQRIELQGVLGAKAVLSIDGQRHVLAAGQSAGGVRLDGVGPTWALVEAGGERRRIELGSSVTGGYAVRESREARVYPDQNGMYLVIGRINGFPMRMLLDTGATYVGLDAGTARRIGLNYRIDGERTVVHTAAGQAMAYDVRLDSVAVGDINLANVEAFVIEGAGPDVPLLGMSFLRRLSVRTDGRAMVLEAR